MGLPHLEVAGQRSLTCSDTADWEEGDINKDHGPHLLWPWDPA